MAILHICKLAHKDDNSLKAKLTSKTRKTTEKKEIYIYIYKTEHTSNYSISLKTTLANQTTENHRKTKYNLNEPKYRIKQ